MELSASTGVADAEGADAEGNVVAACTLTHRATQTFYNALHVGDVVAGPQLALC
jgi:hypothetical protein